MPMPENRRSGMEAFQPMLQAGQRGMAGEIDLQRSHRDITLIDGFEIRARSRVLLRPRGSHPVHGPPARVARGQDGLRTMAKSEPRATKAMQRRRGYVGNIDVERSEERRVGEKC